MRGEIERLGMFLRHPAAGLAGNDKDGGGGHGGLQADACHDLLGSALLGLLPDESKGLAQSVALNGSER